MYKSVLQLNQVPPHVAQLHPYLVSVSFLRAQIAGGAHLHTAEGCVGQPASEALNQLTLFSQSDWLSCNVLGSSRCYLVDDDMVTCICDFDTQYTVYSY
jgi:hypothetical protein